MGAKDADRLARLHQHGFVVAQGRERAHHGVEGGPGSRRPAGSAVDDEIVWTLGHLGIEIVHQHSYGGLLLPPPGGELSAARGADGAGAGGCSRHGVMQAHRRPIVYRFPLHPPGQTDRIVHVEPADD